MLKKHEEEASDLYTPSSIIWVIKHGIINSAEEVKCMERE